VKALTVLLLFPSFAFGAPVRVVATDAGFEAPATIAAGTRHVVFENHGTQIHEAMFVKLARGTSASDYAAQVRSGTLFPKGALDYSGPGLTSPGEATELWLRLDVGDYALICWNHSHAGVRALSVRDTGAPDDSPPREDVIVKLADFRFELSGAIRKGEQVLRVETPGPSMHEMDIFRLHSGRTASDVQRWYKQDDLKGAAPADALGGALDSHDIRHVVWIRKAFTPGMYVLHCAMPMSTDAKSGDGHASHADAGMVTTFEVKD